MDLNKTILFLETFAKQEHINAIIDSLIANFLWVLPTVLISLFTFIVLYKKYKKTVQAVDFQTYIFGEISYVVCNTDKYKISNIPDILLKYRNRLILGKKKKNNVVYFWQTRISTFVVFTDGKRILLFNRKDNPKKEAVNNPKMDVYGAKSFHNNTLKFKLPSYFMDSEIKKMHSVPGIVIEENKVSFIEFLKNIFKNETVVMIGFIAYLEPDDLEKGLELDIKNEIDDNDNILLPLTCLNTDDNNLTAKAKIAIKYLHSQNTQIDYEEKCIDYCGKKPFLYENNDIVVKDNLTKINGIGNKLEKILNKLGVYKYEQLANWTSDNIEWVENHLYFPGRIKREKWIEQAKDIIQGRVNNLNEGRAI